MPLNGPALQYFLAVFETGSINAAARRLYVASSAVSRQIARLEHEVGTPLLERLPTGVQLTHAGNVFAGYARRAIQEATHVVDEVHQRTGAPTSISIAATDGTGHDFIPRVAANFRAEYPDVRFVLEVAEHRAVTQKVRDGTVDVGVTFNLTIDGGVKIMYSREAPLKALMRTDHPLAERQRVSLRDLATYPLALSSPAATNRFLLDTYSAAHDLPVDPAFVCENADAVMRFIQQSPNAITLLGQITLPLDVVDADLVAIPLREKEFSQRSLQVQCKAGRTLPPTVSKFAELLINALERSEV